MAADSGAVCHLFTRAHDHPDAAKGGGSTIFTICEVIFILLFFFLTAARDREEEESSGDGDVQPLNGEECDDGNKVVTDECVGRSGGQTRLSSQTSPTRVVRLLRKT